MSPPPASTPAGRHYSICRALDMTCLSIELQGLEDLGVDKRIIARWKDRAHHLLQDILDVSDSITG